MSEIFGVVLAYFDQMGWPVEQDEQDEILRLEYEGDNGSWFCYARARAEADQFIFLSVLSDKVPSKKRILMAEFLTRANFGLNIGNFEMDFDDGEVRFKTSIDVTQSPLTIGLVDPLVKASLMLMDDYLPGINAVLSGDMSPSEAVEMVREADDDVDLFF